ncbi:MAG TPA: SDR family oxidoreductase [Longimicrobiales bacterium]|nr:SDR family oxidoreductase [Longimicrobiales bacterium]
MTPFKDDLLANKTALITGGGSGLGLTMARKYLELGARVAIIGRNEERLGAAARELDAGERLATFSCDVRDADQVERMMSAVYDAFSALDIVVNNAAGNFLAATEDLSPNAFDAVVRTVLHGTFNVTVAAGRRMIEQQHNGVFLNIITTYAWTGSAFVVPSAVSKAGVLALTRSLAVEWATYGIRLNAIAPGPFPTEGAWTRLLPTPELERESLSRIPMGRFGEHEEFANLAAFLVSDAAPYINGECVTIDGGAWLSSGGLFNGLTRVPRAQVKDVLRKFRRKS